MILLRMSQLQIDRSNMFNIILKIKQFLLIFLLIFFVDNLGAMQILITLVFRVIV